MPTGIDITEVFTPSLSHPSPMGWSVNKAVRSNTKTQLPASVLTIWMVALLEDARPPNMHASVTALTRPTSH